MVVMPIDLCQGASLRIRDAGLDNTAKCSHLLGRATNETSLSHNFKHFVQRTGQNCGTPFALTHKN